MPRQIKYLKSDTLSVARSYLAAGYVGSYALFAGGINSSGNSDVVDAISDSLVKSTPTVLSVARSYLSCAMTIDREPHLLFAGGSDTVDAYDTSLIRSTVQPLSVARSYVGGTSAGDFAVFAGGLNGTRGSNVVDAYDGSLTKITVQTPLTSSEKAMAAATAGSNNHAIFASNYYDSTGNVWCYNSSLTQTILDPLSSPRVYMCGVSAFHDRAIFAGGGFDLRGTSTSSMIDMYIGPSHTHSTRSMPSSKYQLAGAASYKYLILAGGYDSTAHSNGVTIYDDSMTLRSTDLTLSDSRCRLAATNIGNFDFIFAGGYDGNYVNTVDIFEDSWKNVKTSKVMYGNQVVIDLTGDTVAANKMLSGSTAHDADGEVIVGTLAFTPAGTYTPGTTDQTISSGQILSGEHVLKGDANLLAENIKAGVTIFGVTGDYEL